MKRETFGSRIGFILVSAGCAIGIGNVWKFPYLCGEYGGAAFILIYLIFLLIMGIPVLVCEFSIGRASRFSVAASFEKLEPQGTRWHWTKWIGIVGSYLLMMFYTTVGGWLLYYCFKSIKGDFNGASTEEVTAAFSEVMGNMPVMAFWTILICVIGFAVCVFGIQKGIERASKFMMSILLVLMIILAIHSVFMEGAGEGIHFYLVPDFAKMAEQGIGNVIFAALSQSFFTLSIGIGAMMIFGSYMPKERTLLGEAVSITALDTSVALTAGFIIIPACFAFGIEPGRHPVAWLLDAEIVEHRLLFIAGAQTIDHAICLAGQAIECLPLFEGTALAHIAFLVRLSAHYRIALETIAFVITPFYPFAHERHILIGPQSGPLGLVDKPALYIFKGL